LTSPDRYAPPPKPLIWYPHEEPEPYHRVLRVRDYRPWRPMVGLLVLVVLALGVLPILALVVPIGWAIAGGHQATYYLDHLSDKTVTTPVLAYTNVVLGGLAIAAWTTIRTVHRMRPRWLSSVVPGLRWRWLGVCAGMALGILFVQALAAVVFSNDSTAADAASSTRTQVTLAFVVLLTTPLQAAGEEYFFRGYVNQAIGAYFRSPLPAMVATSLLFALAHGTQNAPLFVDRLSFGLVAAFVVWRTGGLEAGIAWHVVNNLVVLLYAVATHTMSSTLLISQVSWGAAVLDVAVLLVFAAAVIKLAQRRQLQRLTTAPPSGAFA
jgi:membrane protease YdiL (CAAX protease family)